MYRRELHFNITLFISFLFIQKENCIFKIKEKSVVSLNRVYELNKIIFVPYLVSHGLYMLVALPRLDASVHLRRKYV